MGLLFENTEILPEDFYLKIMNMIKVYYDYRQNLNEIYSYLDQNKERVEPELLTQIKSYIKPEPVVYDYDRLFKIIMVVVLLSIFPGSMVFVYVLNIIKH